jgi:hypothetical protein
MATKLPVEFTPVPVAARHDGWTAEKQIRFIQALADTSCVEDACRRVGMSDSAAYKLRNRPCGAPFRRAWDAALDCSAHRLEQASFDRTINGVARPIFHNGEQVGEWRYYDERLTMFLLRHRRPARYGKWLDRMLAPDPEDSQDDGVRLDGPLSEIEFDAPEEGGNPVAFEDEGE